MYLPLRSGSPQLSKCVMLIASLMAVKVAKPKNSTNVAKTMTKTPMDWESPDKSKTGIDDTKKEPVL